MDNNVVIDIKNLSKEYRLGTINHGTLARDLQSWWAKVSGKEDPNSRIAHVPRGGTEPSSSPENERFLALRDISMQVRKGEVIGIIGRNGAGKSTLLKILSRITSPTTGEVRLRGRMASLLEVGTGFHGELTGRENIYLNGAILGMMRREISRKFDEIVGFAELEKFIDTPVKRYSSGMYMRLAFAVAAHLDVEIMLVDEVLAVGDINFRTKCLGKMKEIGSDQGRTILFVSHDMASIRQLCQRVVLLSKGEVQKAGTTEEVTAFYEALSLAESKAQEPTRTRNPLPHHYHLNKVELRNAQGVPCCQFSAGEEMEIHLWSCGEAPANSYTVEFILFNAKGNRVSFGAANPLQNTYFKKEDTHFVCRLGPLPLTMGVYSFYFSIRVWGLDRWDEWENAINFEIRHCDMFATGFEVPSGAGGDFIINQKWEARNA